MSCDKDCVIAKLTPHKDVSLVVSDVKYTGKFIEAKNGVVVLVDPYKINYISSEAVQIAVITDKEEKDEPKEVKCQREAAVKAFRSILKSLKGSTVDVQVNSNWIQGIVKKVSKSKLYLSTGHEKRCCVTSEVEKKKSLNCVTTSIIALDSILAVLVPLLSARRIEFGDLLGLQSSIKQIHGIEFPLGN